MLISRNKILLLVLSALSVISDSFAITSLAKNDPDPVYTSLDPHTFLYTRKKLQLKGYDVIPDRREYFGVSISPFGQNSDIGNNAAGIPVNLGDVNGPWDMLTLVYGNLPINQSLPPILTQAQLQIFPGGAGLNNPDYVDLNCKVGFFTIPMVYRKRGVRFEFDANIIDDFGISVQTGVTDMSQTLSAQGCFLGTLQGFINETVPVINYNSSIATPPAVVPGTAGDLWLGNSGCEPGISICAINKFLMDQLNPIAQAINLDIDNFHTVSIEEVRLNAYWRHAFGFNTHTDDDWPEFLLIPFFQASGSLSPGTRVNPNKAFAPTFGDNGFNAAGFNTGINFDFFDTIEIGAEFGWTHFFKRDCVNIRMPNSPFQTGIYPFTTNVNYQPGDNWNFGAKIAAYHFIDRLSMYFQWMLVEHRRDKICLVQADPAFLPHVLEEISDWKLQVANVGFNYDIAPYVSLGFFWQAPLNQHNVYKCTTVMLSLNGSY